jgi:carboxyl-terminal processing protease
MLRRALLIVAGCLALLCAGIVLGGRPEALPGPVADVLVGHEEARVVSEALDDVHERYYREVPKDVLADKAIAGAVESLDDRFSQYFPPKEYARFKDSQNSEFTGVGISVAPDGGRGLRVIEVFDGSPARRAGIERGDVITAVDRRSLRGLSQNRAVALIKGEPGSDVTLRILHDGREREVSLTRAVISVPAVASRIAEEGGRRFAVVKLAQFSSGAHAELYTAIRKALRKGVKGIVLDLRGNPGGLVNEAQLVASAFLEDGKIVTTKGRSVPTRTLKATGDAVAGRTPVVVLVDKDSASASEIVAGALQDRGRAPVVGTPTFGKGVFQQVVELSNGGALDITAGQYYTPKGRNLGGKGTAKGAGLQPDIRAQDDPDTKRDEALHTALRELAREAA